ncbi:Hypothetical predicted protein [Olea europaea subsp. europaea]|uniref:Uncharacterized protein n=1 Tax=Olea europaea subsp. europaea TaxID=158383 RepID=A0A8S0TPS6_OLEEU|nr:Hypothetical predicted protein [Olea europaea subsp. europaea]
MAKDVSLVLALCILAFVIVAHCHAPPSLRCQRRCVLLSVAHRVRKQTQPQNRSDSENDICRVTLINSPEAECGVPMRGLEPAKIECTENSGMTSLVCYADPLGFITKEAVSGCKEVLTSWVASLKDLDV